MSRTIQTDIAVCGGGIAGSSAAIAAAERGAEVCLFERGGCLGGTLTASLIGQFIDRHNTAGSLCECFYELLDKEICENTATLFEAEKYILEKLCRDKGVRLFFYTSVVSVETDDRKIVCLRVHGLDEDIEVFPKVVIDGTGGGSIAAMAGCGYDLGNETGQTQPMSVVGIVSGIGPEGMKYVGWDNRENFKKYLKKNEVSTSMGFPNLTDAGGGLVIFSVNHEYGVDFQNTESLTAAMSDGRRELYDTVKKLAVIGGPFSKLALVNTPELIGIREGRRIHGLYTITLDDVIHGKRHEDAVCTVKYWVDIHALDANGNKSFFGDEIQNLPYDIPFRAQIPKDCDNLIMAGRCISGDFFAHASYRVAGNMICTGEAAGIMASLSVKEGKEIPKLPMYKANYFRNKI